MVNDQMVNPIKSHLKIIVNPIVWKDVQLPCAKNHGGRRPRDQRLQGEDEPAITAGESDVAKGNFNLLP